MDLESSYMMVRAGRVRRVDRVRKAIHLPSVSFLAGHNSEHVALMETKDN